MTDNGSFLALPRYQHCRYSAFISFAHDDNAAANNWVTALRDAMRKRLTLLGKNTPQLEVHYSLENGPTAGQLAHELKERLQESFCLLLVVGPKYVESGWCEKELEYFASMFGSAGVSKRLLIASMTHDAIQLAAGGEQWKKWLPDPKQQLYVPFYDDKKAPSPFNAKLDRETFDDKFFGCVTQLVGNLIGWIEADYKAPTNSTSRSALTTVEGTPWSPQPGRRLRIGIGPQTEDLDGVVLSLVPLLERMNAEVHALDRHLVDRHDPDEASPPLRLALQPLDVLVVPMSFEKPLYPKQDGGHAAVLQEEWAKLGKGRGIVWLRPSSVRSPQATQTLAKHVRILEQLAPICPSEQAVVNLLFGQDATEAVTFYVEKNDDASAYYRLVSALQEGWARLPLDLSHPRPELKCQLIDLNDITSVANNGDAFVLLFPVGDKALSALDSQREIIRKQFPKRGPIYPGLVAVIRDPPPENNVHVQSWTSVMFVRRPEALCVEDNKSQAWLAEFLKDVWQQYRRRTTQVQPAARVG